MKDLNRDEMAGHLYNFYHNVLDTVRDNDGQRTPWNDWLSRYADFASAWQRMADEVVSKGYKPSAPKQGFSVSGPTAKMLAAKLYGTRKVLEGMGYERAGWVALAEEVLSRGYRCEK